MFYTITEWLVSTADGDDYWAEGGMPLPTESLVD